MELDVAALFGHASIPGMSHRFGVFVRSLLAAEWAAVRGGGALFGASGRCCESRRCPCRFIPHRCHCQEESDLIGAEVVQLRAGFAEPSPTPVSPTVASLRRYMAMQKRMRELLIRAVYCHGLGQDMPFAHVPAMLFAHQQRAVALKHMGYLAASVLLAPWRQEAILMCSTVLQDLGRGVVEPCLALAAVPSVVGAATLPALQPAITALLRHTHPLVRRRAALSLIHNNGIDPLPLDVVADVAALLGDDNPNVVLAAASLLYATRSTWLGRVDDVIPRVWAALRRCVAGGWPQHVLRKVPVPWLVVPLLRLLGAAQDRRRHACTRPAAPLTRTGWMDRPAPPRWTCCSCWRRSAPPPRMVRGTRGASP